MTTDGPSPLTRGTLQTQVIVHQQEFGPTFGYRAFRLLKSIRRRRQKPNQPQPIVVYRFTTVGAQCLEIEA